VFGCGGGISPSCSAAQRRRRWRGRSPRAQPAKKPARIGFLPLGSPSNAYDRSLVEAFRQGLRQAGLVESRDVVLDVVWISGDPDQAVTEVMQRGADMLIPCGSSASVAATHLENPVLIRRTQSG